MHKQKTVMPEGTTKSREEMRRPPAQDDGAITLDSHGGRLRATRIVAPDPRKNARLEWTEVPRTAQISECLLAVCFLLRGARPA